MRPSRILAVALRDMRQRVAGRGWYRLPALALALLLPAGAFPSAGRPAAEQPQAPASVLVVRGSIPPAVQSGALVLGQNSRIYISGSDPVRVRAPFIPDELRTALEALPGGPRVELRKFKAHIRLPGRSVLLALLAVSLLTGPLAEALPGERARRTLEVLLSAGISRGELVTGKWLAWTAAATGSALLAAAASVATSVQPAGWWLAGLPLFIATAVALGLWLVRSVADVVGGAAAPMRVLPVLSVGMAVGAWTLSGSHPALAAMVPLGGALLVAGDVLPGPGAFAAAAVGSSATALALLAWTGRDLDRWEGDTVHGSPGAIGLLLIAALGWWLAVGGPGVWAIAGNAGVALSESASLAAGGCFLLLCALVASAREGSLALGLRPAAVLPALAAGLALAFAGRVDTALAAPAWVAPVAGKLAQAAAPGEGGLALCLLVVAGHTLLFRDVVQRRVGMAGAAVAWTLIVCPFDPVRGLVSGLVLGAVAARWGAAAAFIAHTAWALG